MVVTGGDKASRIDETLNVTTDEFPKDVPPTWFETPALFTDLNAPIEAPDGRFDFPIVDPTAQKSSATATDGVDGFEIINPPGFRGNTRPRSNDKNFQPTARPQDNPAPMPVRWLYVLQDGSIAGPPDVGAQPELLEWGSQAAGPGQPSAANPIVGADRILDRRRICEDQHQHRFRGHFLGPAVG
jgi:hypothetical protein